MEPSLVKLENPEDVHLAYAQAASAIEFILGKAGYEGLREVMRRMAVSSDPGGGGGHPGGSGHELPEFEKEWKEFLAAKELKETGGRRFAITR